MSAREPRRVKAICAVLVAAFWITAAQAQAPFYHGKTISIVVGSKPGDLYDLYARLHSEFLPKYLPGGPNVIVQNMPGAGSLIAANHIYNVSKPDGLTLGAIYPGLYFDELSKRPEVKFGWARFSWVGSPVISNHLLYIRTDTPYKSMDDVRRSSNPPKCGANGTASIGYYIPKLLEETVDAKFNIITGYQSGVDVDLAVERGEVVCRAFTITSYFAREPFISWRKRNFVKVLIQTGNKRDARLKEVPTIYELLDKYKASQSARRLTTVVLAAGDFGRPIVASPGVSAERLKVLRDAFEKMVKDPAYVAEAEKRTLELDPTGGGELESLAKEVTAATPDVVQRMQKLLSR